MTSMYIELNSMYRNREEYPNPAEFVVQLAESGQKTSAGALDPVCDSSPILTWNNSFREDVATSSISGITISPTTAPTNMGTDVFKITTTEQFRQIKNFYVGCMLAITIDFVDYVRRIIEFEPINLTTAMVTLESPMPDAAVGGLNASITNPTPIDTTTADSVIKFYVPAGVIIDNYYINYYIDSIGPTLARENRKITAYDGLTRLATLESKTTSNWASNANANQNYCIRKALPVNTGDIVEISSSGKVIQLASTANQESGSYVGSFIRMTEPFPTAPFSTEVAPYNEERRITNYIAGLGTFVTHGGAGTNTFTLPPSASNVPNFYVGAYITDSTTGETRLISTYDSSTHSGTVSVNWGAGSAGDSWYIRTITLSQAFSTNPVVGGADAYEIEAFTRDNYNPLSYNGSMVSLQQESCYEIELINLVLPNKILNSSRGGLTAFYPYIYVQFQAQGSAQQSKRGVLYSNNPHSTKALFRVTIDDTPTPLLSAFIKVDGDGCVITQKFKPNQDFRFAVYHQTGELLTYVDQDTTSPKQADPLVQISACFQIKKVT